VRADERGGGQARTDPRKLAADPPPERLRVADRLGVKALVLRLGSKSCLRAQLLGRREAADLVGTLSNDD
jgi:hypothetical protein